MRGGRYRFLLPLPLPGAGGPPRLEYVDAGGRRHEQALTGHPLPRCAAAAAAPRPAPAPTTSLPTRRRPGESAGGWAQTLDNQATVHVEGTEAACRLDRQIPPPQPTQISPGSPDPTLLVLLGVLRRAATPQELTLAQPSGLPVGPPGVVTVFARFTRVVHGPDGLVATVTVGQGRVSLAAADLPACQEKINRYLEHLIRGQPHDVQFYAREYRRYFKLGPLSLGVHPWLGYSVGRTQGAGGTGGPFDPKQFRATGIVISSQSVGQRPTTALVAGLVPDGVASVTLALPAHLSHGATHVRARYPHPYSATARVIENAFFLPAVPRDAAVAAQRSTLTWRAADGRTIRTISNP